MRAVGHIHRKRGEKARPLREVRLGEGRGVRDWMLEVVELLWEDEEEGG